MKRISFFIALCIALAAAAAPAPKEAFEQFNECWELLGKEKIKATAYANCWQRFVRSGNIGPWADKLREMAEDGLQPDRPKAQRQISVELIGMLPGDDSRKALHELIAEHDYLQGQAARILLKWGDFEAAAPVLEEEGLYSELADDPRGIAILYRALEDHNLLRQITAAEALYTKLDKADSLHNKVRTILSIPADRRNPDVTKIAADILSKDPSDLDIYALAQVVITDTTHWSKMAAFGAVVNLAFQGNADALAQLRMLAEVCPDSDLRSRARGYLKSVSHQQRIADSLRAAGGKSAPSDSLKPSTQGTKKP